MTKASICKTPKCKYYRQLCQSKKMKDNLELWTIGFVSHQMNIFQIDSCICFMFYNKDKDKVIIRGLSDTATWYLVLARQQNLKRLPALLYMPRQCVSMSRAKILFSRKKNISMYLFLIWELNKSIHLFCSCSSRGGKHSPTGHCWATPAGVCPRWELLLYWGMIQTGGCKGIWIIGPGSGTRLWCEKCESGVDKGGQSGEFVSRRVTNLHTSTRSNSNFRRRWNINWWSSSCPLKSSLFQLLSPWCWWKSRVAWVSNWAHLFVRHLFVGTVASAPPDKSIDIQPWLSRTPNNG